IWIEEGYIFDTLLTISLIWISIFGLLAIYSLIDKIFRTLYIKTQTPFFAMQTVILSIKLIFGIICFIYVISILMDKSSVAILSVLGAMSE
ncbi:miniconductance mechanosensitive channel, partial [Aliarcobacter lanthieri]